MIGKTETETPNECAYIIVNQASGEARNRTRYKRRIKRVKGKIFFILFGFDPRLLVCIIFHFSLELTQFKKGS